jgi:hypothetical protein
VATAQDQEQEQLAAPDTAKLMEPGHALGDYIRSGEKKGTYPFIKYVLPSGVVLRDTSYLLFDLLDRVYSALSVLPEESITPDTIKQVVKSIASTYKIPGVFSGDIKEALRLYAGFLADAAEKLGSEGLKQLVKTLIKVLDTPQYKDFLKRLARELEETAPRPRRGVVARLTLPLGGKVSEYSVEYLLKRVPFSEIYTYILIPRVVLLTG